MPRPSYAALQFLGWLIGLLFTVMGWISHFVGYGILAVMVTVTGWTVWRWYGDVEQAVREGKAAKVDNNRLMTAAEERNQLAAQLRQSDEEKGALRNEKNRLLEELSDLIAPSGGTASYPLLKREEISKKYIEDRTVYIADFAREVAQLGWRDAVVRGRTFERCNILGPAVLMSMNTGDLTGLTFVGDEQSWAEGEEAFWSPSPDPAHFTGIIGLEDCVFRNCHFNRVGLLMSEQELRQRRR